MAWEMHEDASVTLTWAHGPHTYRPDLFMLLVSRRPGRNDVVRQERVIPGPFVDAWEALDRAAELDAVAEQYWPGVRFSVLPVRDVP